MEANELRLKNWAIHPASGTEIQLTETDIIQIMERIQDGLNQNYEPIPLTTEWLERAGFVNRYSKDSWNICYEFILSDRSGILQVKSGFLDENKVEDFHIAQNDSFIANAKYVHQLQNLVKCLTGVELEFK